MKKFEIAGNVFNSELRQLLLGLKKAFASKDNIFVRGKSDTAFVILTFSLLFSGLIMCYSALSDNKEMLLQFAIAMGSLAVMWGCSHISMNVYRNLAPLIMLVSFLCMIVLAILKERRIFGVQPSDFFKVSIVLFFAYFFEKYQPLVGKTSFFFYSLFLVLLFALLIFCEKHLSGAILFALIGLSMMWIGNLNRKWFIFSIVFFVISAIILVLVIEKVPLLRDYQKLRITSWKCLLFNKEMTPEMKIGGAYQSLQSLYGISTGGLFGVGFGQSAQKYGNLDEASNDFIFAIMAEELGFIPCLFIIFLFGCLVFEGFRIAAHSKTAFGAFAVTGLCMQIAFQLLLNIGVATSLLPNTGIGLPFYSQGGSSMLSVLAECGIILAVSREKCIVKTTKGEKQNV